MGKRNAALHRAKREKNDEFYTQKKDIEKELIHYHHHLKDKIVYCNCDDYRKSKFVEYFMENFENIGLKKLISTGFSKDGQGTYSEYDGTVFKTGFLSGNGDALGEECTEILKQADVVVTNPPFSLFRKYVPHLMKYGKKFIIIGNGNAVTYKEIFPLIKNNELWVGNKSFGSSMGFVAGENYDSAKCKHSKYDSKGNIIINVMMCVWFTNIPHTKINAPLDLYKKYSSEDYPKYDNYLGFNVDKVADIPVNDFIDIEITDEDYEKWKKVYGDDLVILIINGHIMKVRIKNPIWGVPITFLDKYCSTQFEIVGLTRHNILGMDGDYWLGGCDEATINGKRKYRRLLIRRKKAEPIVEVQ